MIWKNLNVIEEKIFCNVVCCIVGKNRKFKISIIVFLYSEVFLNILNWKIKINCFNVFLEYVLNFVLFYVVFSL